MNITKNKNEELVNRNLYIVESPLQLLCAIEGAHLYSKTTIIIIYSENRKNNDQIKKLFSFIENNVEIIEVKHYLNRQITYIKLLLLIKSFNKYKFDKIFIGSFVSWTMKVAIINIKHNSVFLLDDGVQTITYQKYFYNNSSLENNYRLLYKKLLGMILNLRINNENLKLNLFTCFDLKPNDPNQKIIKHQFSFLKLENKSTSSDTVYFIGSNLSGSKIISQNEVLKALYNIKKYYQKQNLKFLYIAHRLDDEKKLKRINEDLGIPIIKFNNILEIEFINMSTLPLRIASFFSTALYTLSKIFNIKNVDSFRINLDYSNYDKKQHIQNIYNEYSHIFTVLDLSELEKND